MKKPAFIALMILTLLSVYVIRPQTTVSAAPVSGVVTTTSDDGPGSLRRVISEASPGEVITFDLTLPATISLSSGQIVLDKSLTLVGPGAGELTVDGGGAARIFHVSNGVKAFVYGLTLQNGSSTSAGGCVYAGGGQTDVILSRVLVQSCQSDVIGGGIHVSQGRLTLLSATVVDNSAPDGGGLGVSNLGTITAINTTIANNAAVSFGGGIADGSGSGVVVLQHSSVVFNTAGRAEAARGVDLIGAQSSLTMDNTILASNGDRDCLVGSGTLTSNGFNLVQNPDACSFAAMGDQTGVDPLVDNTLAWGTDWPVPLHPLTAASTAIDGGSCIGVSHDGRDYARPFNDSGSPDVDDGCDIGSHEFGVPFGESSVVTSTADSGAGSLRQVVADAPLGALVTFMVSTPAAISLTGSSIPIEEHLIILGPGADQLTLDATLNDRNFVIRGGSFFSLYGMTLTAGQVTASGGCLLVDQESFANLDSLVMTGCTVTGTNQVGGALQALNHSDVSLAYSLITNSQADYGAGAAVGAGGTLTLTNSTISGNTANKSGGAIADGSNGGEVTLQHATLASNVGGSGVDLISNTSVLTVSNSILADNGVNDCVVGSGVTLTSGGYNLVENPNTCTFSGTGDLTGVDPVLEPLALNGGAIMSHALAGGSPAIDAGFCGALGYDQRGQPRPEDHFGVVNALDACDIGAVELTAVDEPTADFIVSATALTVDFTDASTGPIDFWHWDFGDGSSSTAQNPEHTYTSDGDYTVTLTVSNISGSVSHSETVSVAVPPTADFSFSADGLTVDFSDSSTGTVDSWQWDFGDGNTSTTQNPGHTYVAGGAYTVTLTVENAGGTDSTTAIVEVAPVPTADFSFSANALAVDFTDTSTGAIDSWLWDFGDGNTSTAQNPSHIYAAEGDYTVSLTVSNVSSSAAHSETVAVAAAPVAAFTASANALTVDFTDVSTSTVDSWLWDFGDGNTSTAQNPSHTYIAAGTYTITLTVSNVSSSDITSDTVQVDIRPTAAFTFDAGGLAVDFMDTSTGSVTDWLWDFGDGNTSAERNPNHIYAAAGEYTVSLTVSNVSSSDVASTTLGVALPPTASFSHWTDALTVDFLNTSSGTIDSYLWDFGDGNTSTSQHPQHTFAAEGAYTVTLTVNNVSNSVTHTEAIHVAATPTANFDFSVNGLQVDFSDTSSGTVESWFWNFGDGYGSTLQNPTYTYSTAGVYAVSLTVINASSSHTYSRTVRVENLPIVGFTYTVDGFSLQFTDTTVGVVENWLWDFGDGNTSTEQHPLHTYTEAGTYSVVLTVWNAGGENSLAKPVEVTYVLWLPGINK